ncbi:hypothetical protein HHK36_015394 [Tetracentron sinense]|uniref:Uncharacterized protein n=1 Tax=Tetracentron sinense TaxID=13715 RepID=A0A835DG47_TETSI|nr:hypothetical protein HHK36_015394 [Tetracentron sinense]
MLLCISSKGHQEIDRHSHLCWQLGLVEKNILNNDFDLVALDPSDASTNSSTLFSDDTDDKSQRSTLLEVSVPNHWEDKSNAAAAQEPPLKNSFEHNPDVLEFRDQRTGKIVSCPKKTELKVGEFSAFFSYVKSTMPANNSQSAVEKIAAELEYSSKEERLQEWCEQVGDDTHKREIGEAWENYSQDSHFTNNEYGPGLTSSSTPLVPLGFPPRRHSKEEQLSKVLMHPRNESQVDVTGVPAHNHLPKYISGVTNQVMPSSAQPYQNNLHDLQKHATSAMVPQYNHLPQCPPLEPVMATFPYYPVNVYLQSNPTQLCPSIGSSSSTEVKPDRVDRREAALIKFRQKKKERYFGKKIRYFN